MGLLVNAYPYGTLTVDQTCDATRVASILENDKDYQPSNREGG